MIIRLIANQIPKYWEIIKLAAVRADEVDESVLRPYLNDLLHALLNNKAQCFFRVSDDRQVSTVYVTRITFDKITGAKEIIIQNIFSFTPSTMEMRAEELDFMRKFAEAEKCSRAIFQSRNEKVWEIGKMYGAKELYRVFSYPLGGN